MKKPIVRKSDHERGMILVVATIVVIAMLIMATPFLAKLSSQYRITDKSYKGLAAFNLAEEGIDRALWEMNQPYVVTGGIVSIDENGNGTLVATNEAVGDKTGAFQGVITTDYGVEPNIRTIASTGSMPHIANLLVNRTVSVNMEKYYKSIWDMGIFGHIGIYGEGNNSFDSFNSTKGAYGVSLPGGGVNKGSKGHAGTNAIGSDSINFKPVLSSEFYGNLAAGAGADPSPENLKDVISVLDANLKDGSQRRVLSAPFEMPQVDLFDLPPRDMFGTTIDFHTWFSEQPPVDSPLPSSIINAGYNKGPLSSSKSVLTPADSGVYTSFNLAKDKDLTIQGNVAIYVTGLDGVTGSFEPLKNSSITIGANSSLTLILGKTTSVNVINNCALNNTGTAPNCIILGTSQYTGSLSFRNNDDINAGIYMPNASFIVRNNVTLKGAVVCNYLEMRNNAKIHYDEALGELDYIKGGIPYWRVTTWQEPIGD